MKIWLFAFLILTTIVICLRFKGKNKSREIFREAKDFKNSENYRKACYYFALAAYRGYSFEECKENILELWNAHGPWDFNEELKELKKDLSCDYDSCAEGYHEGPMKIIRNIINNKKD